MTDQNASNLDPERVAAEIRSAVKRVRKKVAKPINIEEDDSDGMEDHETTPNR